ncbi:MAG: hypothetical protein JO002_03560, partial [Burkholderiaceae bacterium]|nr:hypothetical protein [Burkholderiaceae bacterium]
MNLAFRPFAAGGPYVRMALRRAPIRPSDICRMDALRSIDENLAVFRKPKVQDVMGLKDALRNFMGIRLERALPPPGTMPPLGSNIALG